MCKFLLIYARTTVLFFTRKIGFIFMLMLIGICAQLYMHVASHNLELELESAYMGAHLADQPVTGEPMKDKPNESTHIQNLPANICPRLQLHPAPLSHQSKIRTAHVCQAFFFSLQLQHCILCAQECLASGVWKSIKNEMCILKTTGIIVRKCRFFLFGVVLIYKPRLTAKINTSSLHPELKFFLSDSLLFD